MFYTRNLVFYLPLNEFVSQIFMFCFHHKMPSIKISFLISQSQRRNLCECVRIFVWGHYLGTLFHCETACETPNLRSYFFVAVILNKCDRLTF